MCNAECKLCAKLTAILECDRGSFGYIASYTKYHKLSNFQEVCLSEQSQLTAILVAACDRDHASVLQVLLEHRANPDTRDTYGNPLLHACAMQGHVASLEVLLRAGARVDARDVEEGVTALHAGAEWGQNAAVEALLAHGAPVDMLCGPSHDTSDGCSSERGVSALMVAAQNGDAPLMQLLLTRRANTGLRDATGRTALHLAVSSDARACVSMLLSAGALVDARDDEGSTALVEAVRVCARNSAARGPEEEHERDGEDSQAPSALSRRLDLVEQLIRARAHPCARDLRGWGALENAAAIGDLPLVALLLRYGGAVELAEGTQCIVARVSGGVSEAGADAEADTNAEGEVGVSEQGGTSKRMVCGLACEVVHPLRANVAATDGRAGGAAARARAEGAAAARDVLCEVTATPLMMALVADGFGALVQLLLKHGGVRGRAILPFACACGQLGHVSALLAAGADVWAEDRDGRHALLALAGRAVGVCEQAVHSAHAPDTAEDGDYGDDGGAGEGGEDEGGAETDEEEDDAEHEGDEGEEGRESDEEREEEEVEEAEMEGDEDDSEDEAEDADEEEGEEDAADDADVGDLEGGEEEEMIATDDGQGAAVVAEVDAAVAAAGNDLDEGAEEEHAEGVRGPISRTAAPQTQHPGEERDNACPHAGVANEDTTVARLIPLLLAHAVGVDVEVLRCWSEAGGGAHEPHRKRKTVSCSTPATKAECGREQCADAKRARV